MNSKLSVAGIAGLLLSVHDYKIEPKSRFTPGKMKLDGKEKDVKVTGVGHAKFPAYTYWRDDAGALKYVQGDFRDKELSTVAASMTAPAEVKSTPAAPATTEAKPLPAPQQHGKRR